MTLRRITPMPFPGIVTPDLGVEIDSAWGRGYCLSTANKAKVAAYLTQAQQAAE